jgi:hypothetical protein
MATSKPYILGGQSFQTEVNEDASTVKRLPVVPYTQQEVNSATATGNLNSDGSISYANVYGKGNYEQLAAPDEWMNSLSNDATYWNTINQSIGGENLNLSFDPNLNLTGGVLSTNTDTNGGSTSADASGDLRYPLSNDGSYDYLKISTHELNRFESLLGEGQQGFKLQSPDERLSGSIGPTIVLPMQPGISDSNSVDWGSDQLNPLQLAGARLGAGLIENLSKFNFGAAGSDALESIRSSLSQAGLSIDPSDIITYFAGQAVGANIFTRSTGKVINPNLELLFRGPQLRSFNYNYTFTPRSSKEAVVVKKIIRHLKKYMAVRKEDPGLFLKTPHVFKLSYIYSEGGQHPFLNKIKPCALTNLNVEYTPDGSYMTYKDGSMTSYTVSMQFSELTPIYESDYQDSDNDMGF